MAENAGDVDRKWLRDPRWTPHQRLADRRSRLTGTDDQNRGISELSAIGAPTPWLGVVERVMIYSYLLWIAVFALGLLRRSR